MADTARPYRVLDDTLQAYLRWQAMCIFARLEPAQGALAHRIILDLKRAASGPPSARKAAS